MLQPCSHLGWCYCSLSFVVGILHGRVSKMIVPTHNMPASCWSLAERQQCLVCCWKDLYSNRLYEVLIAGLNSLPCCIQSEGWDAS